MPGLKESVKVNVEGAILGVEESGFSFINQFKAMPLWKQRLALSILIALLPLFFLARFGTEHYLVQKYGRQALSAHPSFDVAQSPVIGDMTIIKNPNDTYSAVIPITNPNLDLAASDISYSAVFKDSSQKIVYTTSGTLYLLPNEKKNVVFARLESPQGNISSGKIELTNVNWQKKLDIPEVKLRATEPMLYDESNPLMFVAEGSIINESPYRVGSARIVFLLYDASNRIIGVSQRDEYALVPFGRRAYKQLWPGIYKSQVKKVQVIPATNTLDPKNITTDPQNANTTQPL
jgi:hypothetical protein